MMMNCLYNDKNQSTLRKGRKRRHHRRFSLGQQQQQHQQQQHQQQQPKQHQHHKYNYNCNKWRLSWPAFLVAIAGLCWLILIASTQSALDQYYLQHHSVVDGTSALFWLRLRRQRLQQPVLLRGDDIIRQTRPPVLYDNPKYIMFLPIEGGQGIGNIMNGLLAAHLVGEEFGRVVCVSTRFKAFHKAFVPLHPQAIRGCSQLAQDADDTERIKLFNYYDPPNECELRDTLASATTVLYLIGNTYPRWPAVPKNMFIQYYQAKSDLIEALPWKQPPHTVVHLRQPDSILDRRQGLDEASLRALGKNLPRHDTFLVTNRVDWYEYFERHFGWAHPTWYEVKHSALGVSWGRREAAAAAAPALLRGTDRQRLRQSRQTFQLWCDWYTILLAQRVVHTHSDFSLSAIHWMNIENAKTIQGVANDGTLLLRDESWRVDGEVTPLSNRTRDELKLCSTTVDEQHSINAMLGKKYLADRMFQRHVKSQQAAAPAGRL